MSRRNWKAANSIALRSEHETLVRRRDSRVSASPFCCSNIRELSERVILRESDEDARRFSILPTSLGFDLFAPLMPGINDINDFINDFWLAFCSEPGKLPSMKFTAYSYWWRFTYRPYNRQRGAIV